ncbi:hypothetical protein MMYC01_202622 [Madurella mycetomatis]|uniref:Uncharacterized protein n=1 Tax=Madurella mycetomatis TaxID=100816 RepID=A0A175WAA8_9PEZI|nr:hypothetical protein MMYC01_205800 [Madurella mycetomatis]KXX80543.1 hypothetical protein MMYC01_202622 [Madurella mycetomatis]
MILFETTESVIEVLWDIAIAFFVVRLAAIYAALTAGAALLALLLLRHVPDLPLLPHLLPPGAGGWDGAPITLLFLASSALCSRFLIARYQIPRSGPFRLAVGVAAAVFGMVGQAVTRFVLYEAGWELDEGVMLSWEPWMGVMGAFAVMPVMWMGIEKGWEAGVKMGKSTENAVPAVGGPEKRKV